MNELKLTNRQLDLIAELDNLIDSLAYAVAADHSRPRYWLSKFGGLNLLTTFPDCKSESVHVGRRYTVIRTLIRDYREMLSEAMVAVAEKNKRVNDDY